MLINYLYLYISSGVYWIDPNGGCRADSFQVQCDYEDGSCATCIDVNNWVCFSTTKMSLG